MYSIPIQLFNFYWIFVTKQNWWVGRYMSLNFRKRWPHTKKKLTPPLQRVV